MGKSPFFCSKCEEKPTCKKICPELENELPGPQEGRMKNESMMSLDILDKVGQMTSEYGTKKIPTYDLELLDHKNNKQRLTGWPRGLREKKV